MERNMHTPPVMGGPSQRAPSNDRRVVVHVTRGSGTQLPELYELYNANPSTYRAIKRRLDKIGLPSGVFYLPNIGGSYPWNFVPTRYYANTRVLDTDIYYGIGDMALSYADRLFDAIATNRVGEVEDLLSSGADPNIPYIRSYCFA